MSWSVLEQKNVTEMGQAGAEFLLGKKKQEEKGGAEYLWSNKKADQLEKGL